MPLRGKDGWGRGAVIRIIWGVGVYLGLGLLIAKVIQVLGRDGDDEADDVGIYVWTAILWPLMVPIWGLAIIWVALEEFFTKS